MVNQFRDSFLRKTFLFLTANDAGRRDSGSHTSMTEHVTHRASHTLTFAFILTALAPLSLSYFASPSQLCPFTTSQKGKWGSEERGGGKKKKKKRRQTQCLQNLPFSPSRSRSSLSPSLLAPVSGMSWPCVRGVPSPSVSSQLNLLILLRHAAPLHSKRNKSPHVQLAYTHSSTASFYCLK